MHIGFDSEFKLITDLLPYDDSTILRDKKSKMECCLYLDNLLSLSIQSLQDFKNMDLILFDAQVSENLCQIRALKTLELFTIYSDNNFYKINQLISRLEVYQHHLREKINLFKHMIESSHKFTYLLDEAQNINYFYSCHDLDLIIEEDVIYLTSCYILTKFNIVVEHSSVGINKKELSQYLNISLRRADKLYKYHQSLVSILSCKYILNLSKIYSNTIHYDVLFSMLRVGDHNRYVLPGFFATELICEHLRAMNLNVVFIFSVHDIETKEFITEAAVYSVNGEFINFDFSDIHHVFPCMVLYGTVQMKANDLIAMDLFKLFLANAASHPQYAGNNLVKLSIDPFLDVELSCSTEIINYYKKKLQSFQKFAEENGCTILSQKALFLKHIYASNSFCVIRNLNITDKYKSYII